MSILSSSMLSLPPVRVATPKPLYAQVRDLLLTRIRSGEWAAGESLPNEHVLSSDFDVSIGTVRRAVAELEANGVLLRKQGRGTYVSGNGSSALEAKFCALRTPEGLRVAPAYELISLTQRTPSAIERTSLPAAETHDVVEIIQRVEAAGRTIGLETAVVPAALFPKLETQLRFGQHLYPVLADYGYLVTRVEDSIGVERAGEETVSRLGCAIDAPLLLVSRIAIALDGQAVERRTGRYFPDLVRYAV